jgi:subfamily B ATP-binding cassette protein MsbA
MPTDANASIASRLRRFVYPHRWGAALTVLAFVGVAATETMIPRLVGYAFGEGFAKDAFPLWTVPAVLIGLYLVRGLFGFAGQYLFNWTITRSVTDFRAELVNALLRLDAKIYTRMQPGTAVSKVVNDPQQILQLVGNVGLSVLRDGLPAIAMVGYLFFLNWQLTLLSLIVTPLMALVMKKVNQRMRIVSTRAYDSQLLLVNRVDDMTRAWRVVRQFGAAAHELERFAEVSQIVRRNDLKTAAAGALAQPVLHHLRGTVAGAR